MRKRDKEDKKERRRVESMFRKMSDKKTKSRKRKKG